MTRFNEPSNVEGRDMAYITAVALDDGRIEIKLHEHWKPASAYVKLSQAQAVLFAEEILEIVKDGGVT